MAVGGRRPKPTHLHIIEGTFDVSRHSKRLKREPKPVGDLTDPPEWFTAGQREVWVYGLKHAPAGLLKAIDQGTYVAWCVASDTHRMAVEKFNKLGEDGLVTEAARSGREFLSPLIELINRQAMLMLRHANEMGFTPSGRARVSVDPRVEANPFDEFAS